MKKPVKILILVVVILFVLVAGKNMIAQTILARAVSNAAHVPVKIGSVNLSFLSASIRLKNLRVHNPAGFPEKLMVDIPLIYIDFEPGALAQGRAHFKEVRLDLKELTVVRDKSGRLNVDAVKPTEEEKRRSEQKAKTSGKAPKLMIDKLFISVGRVVYKDYSSGGEPATQIFDINIKDREYNNIDNPTAIVSLVMFEALTRTTLSRLANLDVNAFKEGGIQALSKGLGLVTDGTDAVQNSTKKLLNLFE